MSLLSEIVNKCNNKVYDHERATGKHDMLLTIVINPDTYIEVMADPQVRFYSFNDKSQPGGRHFGGIPFYIQHGQAEKYRIVER